MAGPAEPLKYLSSTDEALKCSVTLHRALGSVYKSDSALKLFENADDLCCCQHGMSLLLLLLLLLPACSLQD